MTMDRARGGWMWSLGAMGLLAWGVLSFGAARPWGYLPLIVGMAAYGAAALANRAGASGIGRELAFALAAFCAAIFIQLLPMPADMLRTISPTTALVAESQGAALSAPISIDSRATALGLAFVIALGLFFIGVIRTMGRNGGRRLAIGLVGLGTLVALIGIIESGTPGAGMYEAAGLRLPPDSMPHGPFSSRNHYAGWMLMTLAVTIGYFCALVERAGLPAEAGPQKPAGASRRPGIGQILIVACAAATMAVAVVQTESRAAIICLAVAMITLAGSALRRHGLAAKGMLLASPLLLLPLTAAAATDFESIAARFGADSWTTAHGRLPIWRQAAAIARDFPVTGSGFNTYQAVVPLYPATEFDEPYEAAHNDFLQMAAEGGLLVGFPALAVVGFFVGETRQRFRESRDAPTDWLRAGAVAGLCLIAIQETVDFSLQIPGNAALFVVLAAIAVHRVPSEPTVATQEEERMRHVE
jgi:O-antigen ligase